MPMLAAEVFKGHANPSVCLSVLWNRAKVERGSADEMLPVSFRDPPSRTKTKNLAEQKCYSVAFWSTGTYYRWVPNVLENSRFHRKAAGSLALLSLFLLHADFIDNHDNRDIMVGYSVIFFFFYTSKIIITLNFFSFCLTRENALL